MSKQTNEPKVCPDCKGTKDECLANEYCWSKHWQTNEPDLISWEEAMNQVQERYKENAYIAGHQIHWVKVFVGVTPISDAELDEPSAWLSAHSRLGGAEQPKPQVRDLWMAPNGTRYIVHAIEDGELTLGCVSDSTIGTVMADNMKDWDLIEAAPAVPAPPVHAKMVGETMKENLRSWLPQVAPAVEEGKTDYICEVHHTRWLGFQNCPLCENARNEDADLRVRHSDEQERQAIAWLEAHGWVRDSNGQWWQAEEEHGQPHLAVAEYMASLPTPPAEGSAEPTLGLTVEDVCKWCAEGFPVVPSSVSLQFFHPESPVGRVLCQAQQASFYRYMNMISDLHRAAQSKPVAAEGSAKLDKHSVKEHFSGDDYHSRQIRERVQGFTYGEFATLLAYIRAAQSKPVAAEGSLPDLDWLLPYEDAIWSGQKELQSQAQRLRDDRYVGRAEECEKSASLLDELPAKLRAALAAQPASVVSGDEKEPASVPDPTPAGWRCFHCEFYTTDKKLAAAHFGDRDDAEEFKPICKWWSNMDDQERKEAFQDVIAQLNDALDSAPVLSGEREAPRVVVVTEEHLHKAEMWWSAIPDERVPEYEAAVASHAELLATRELLASLSKPEGVETLEQAKKTYDVNLQTQKANDQQMIDAQEKHIAELEAQLAQTKEGE